MYIFKDNFIYKDLVKNSTINKNVKLVKAALSSIGKVWGEEEIIPIHADIYNLRQSLILRITLRLLWKAGGFLAMMMKYQWIATKGNFGVRQPGPWISFKLTRFGWDYLFCRRKGYYTGIIFAISLSLKVLLVVCCSYTHTPCRFPHNSRRTKIKTLWNVRSHQKNTNICSEIFKGGT